MAKHDQTLEAVFAKPTRANVRYTDVIALLKHKGAEVDEGREGSRVLVLLRGQVLRLHRPHPRKELGKATLEDVRDFLTLVGEGP